ncbi:MAG: SDR family NAD(P)-dependent oxidoreductase, partial [Betaproteobacteria bacterium]|nr:SDR family NAD(P)-dependent oxidoreductase [Betaproteobacteria bacterium]
MDLGIKGRWALVCASSKGLGLGCAASLAAEGVNLVMNARSEPLLNEEAKRLAAEYGVTVHAVAGDITTEAIRQKALAAAPQIDILIN